MLLVIHDKDFTTKLALRADYETPKQTPPMIKITIQTNDGLNLSRLAAELERGLPDALLAVATELAGFIQEDFETKSRGGTGASGIKWEPLSEATVKKKSKRAKGGDTSTQIGVDTGLMRSTIQPTFKAPDSKGGSIFKIDGNEVDVGFGRTYAKYFDEGRPATTRLKKKNRSEIKKIIADNGDRIRGLDSTAFLNKTTSGGQPARPLIPEEPPAEWVEAAEEIVQDWIQDLWDKRSEA